MAETNGTAAVQDASPSLAEFVSDLHGDFLPAEPDSPAGAPPATNPETPQSEGTQAASAEASPANAGTVPDQNAQGPESDPLEGSAPLGYVVNGEQRTFDGITKLREGGGIIDPDAMAKVERVFGERDHLFESNRAQYGQIEALTRLTEWQVRDANNQVQTLTGREGVEAQRLALGHAVVEVSELRAALRDPQILASLLLVEPDGQGGTRITGINEEALKDIGKRVNLAQREASLQVRAAMARYAATPQAPAQATPTFDAVANAPQIVEHVIKAGGVTGLGDEDKKWAAAYVPRFVRTATQDDVRQNPAAGFRAGEPIVDPAFLDLLQDRAKLRASTSAQVTNASEAAKRNQANLAAANVGKKPVPRSPAPAATDPTPHQQREADEDAAFTRHLVTSAGLMRQT